MGWQSDLRRGDKVELRGNGKCVITVIRIGEQQIRLDVKAPDSMTITVPDKINKPAAA